MRQTPTTDKLLASLKRHTPAKVRAYAGDDDARDIAVPTRRKRWNQVIEAIEARAWVRVELLDKSGAVLGYVDNTSPAHDLEDVGSGLPPGAGGQVLLAERIAGMVLKAQRDAMTFRDAEVTALLKAQGDVVRELVIGVRAMGELYREQVAAAENAAELRAAALAGDDNQVKQLLEAAPAILQLLPMLRQLVGGTDGTTTNGVKKAS